MIPSSSAKIRARKRARDAGAVVIIVAMALAVLATMGIYALRSSQIELQTSGSARQRLQTHYLDEYALIGTSQYLSGDVAAIYLRMYYRYTDQSLAASDENTDDGCASVSGLPVTAPRESRWCKRLSSRDIGFFFRSAAGQPRAPLDVWDGGTTPGSLGGAVGGNSMGGDFWVELTEPQEGPPLPGYSTNRCYVYFTVTGLGATVPRGHGDAGVTAGLGMESARARLRTGPVDCIKNAQVSK